MDIMEEIEETIREKRSKWNYTPMRESEETDAIIDQLLREFAPKESSSNSRKAQRPVPPVKPAAVRPSRPVVHSEPKDEMEERAEYERFASADKTMVYSRKEMFYSAGEAEEDIAEDSDSYPDEYYEDSEFEDFIGAEDDFILYQKPSSSSGIVKTVLKILITAIIAGFCLLGILTTVNYVIDRQTFGNRTGISANGSNSSQNDELKKVIYPAVAVDIDDFESISDLSSESMINTAVYEIIINGDISVFKGENGDIVIPENQMKYVIEKLFGSSAKFKNVTAGVGDITILYDKSQKEYIIAEKNDVYSYVPKVADVTKSEADKYSVLVEYYNDSPSWADSGERQPIKRKMFTLEKTSEYYNIVSVKTV